MMYSRPNNNTEDSDFEPVSDGAPPLVSLRSEELDSRCFGRRPCLHKAFFLGCVSVALVVCMLASAPKHLDGRTLHKHIGKGQPRFVKGLVDEAEVWPVMPVMAVAGTLHDASSDFSGKWLQVDYEGDMGALLTELGVGWLKRNLAMAMDYGKGFSTEDIRMTRDMMTVVERGAGQSKTISIAINGEEQTFKGLGGNEVTAMATWQDDGSLKTVTSSGITITRRLMDSGKMVVGTTMKSGLTVKRIFAKQ